MQRGRAPGRLVSQDLDACVFEVDCQCTISINVKAPPSSRHSDTASGCDGILGLALFGATPSSKRSPGTGWTRASCEGCAPRRSTDSIQNVNDVAFACNKDVKFKDDTGKCFKEEKGRPGM